MKFLLTSVEIRKARSSFAVEKGCVKFIFGSWRSGRDEERKRESERGEGMKSKGKETERGEKTK